MKKEIEIIHNSEYPEKLKKIKDSPKKLYFLGNIELLFKDSFAIVGTRNPTEYGRKICKEFSKEFALRNIPIISGMALGIDEIAHKTTLDFECETIAVLGFGIEYAKSCKNNKVFNEIIEKNGLIISEYGKNEMIKKENFPKRNRIISALSEGVLVIEAPYRSGSSITARYSREYEKKVFAIPGRIGDSKSVGTNNLIKKGAILVSDINEIVNTYPQFVNKKRKTIVEKVKFHKLNKELNNIIEVLKFEPKTIDEISEKTKESIENIYEKIFELEVEGIIEEEFGFYKMKEKNGK